MSLTLSFPRSVTGRLWTWRGAAGECDDLVDQLLLARGCSPETLAAHRSPTIRDFMPDPSIFRDVSDVNDTSERNQMMFADGGDGNVFDHYDIVLRFAWNDFDFGCGVFVQAAANFCEHFGHTARRIHNTGPSRVFANAFQNQTDSIGDLV